MVCRQRSRHLHRQTPRSLQLGVWIQNFRFHSKIAPELLSWISGRHSNDRALLTNVSRRDYTLAGCGNAMVVVLALGFVGVRGGGLPFTFVKKYVAGCRKGSKPNYKSLMLSSIKSSISFFLSSFSSSSVFVPTDTPLNLNFKTTENC